MTSNETASPLKSIIISPSDQLSTRFCMFDHASEPKRIKHIEMFNVKRDRTLAQMQCKTIILRKKMIVHTFFLSAN